MTPVPNGFIPSGIAPLDDRTGGLEPGGTYLVVGAPGPAKMVATLQYLAAGIARGERSLLITNADAEGILEVATAWGFDLTSAWHDGTLQIVGFRDDFELRAIRSIEPEEVLEELDSLIEGAPDRIAVDPGSLFLTGGARTLLGSVFIAWANAHPATVLATFSVDASATELPSSADWLINATTGRLVLERRSGGLYQITALKSLPAIDERDASVTLELKPGEGLVKPDSLPSRRGADRGAVDRNRLLLVMLGPSTAGDIETWAGRAFDADVVSEPFEAVARVQEDARHGCVLVNAPRVKVREAVQACRALRPLTRAAIVFASDDAIRSTDRIHILEAGADDCLSGGLDFRELGLRIRQSMESGAKPIPERPTAPPAAYSTNGADGADVPWDHFRSEIDRRAEDADLTFFCVLDVSSPKTSAADLQDELAALVRSDEGDLVSVGGDRCLALLQGAREAKLDAFLERLRSRIGDSKLRVEVLSHPANAEGIAALMGTAVAQNV